MSMLYIRSVANFDNRTKTNTHEVSQAAHDKIMTPDLAKNHTTRQQAQNPQSVTDAEISDTPERNVDVQKDISVQHAVSSIISRTCAKQNEKIETNNLICPRKNCTLSAHS